MQIQEMRNKELGLKMAIDKADIALSLSRRDLNPTPIRRAKVALLKTQRKDCEDQLTMIRSAISAYGKLTLVH